MTIQTQGGGGVGVLNVLVTIQIHRVGELEYLTFGDKTDPGGGGVGVLNVW